MMENKIENNNIKLKTNEEQKSNYINEKKNNKEMFKSNINLSNTKDSIIRTIIYFSIIYFISSFSQYNNILALISGGFYEFVFNQNNSLFLVIIIGIMIFVFKHISTNKLKYNKMNKSWFKLIFLSILISNIFSAIMILIMKLNSTFDKTYTQLKALGIGGSEETLMLIMTYLFIVMSIIFSIMMIINAITIFYNKKQIE